MLGPGSVPYRVASQRPYFSLLVEPFFVWVVTMVMCWVSHMCWRAAVAIGPSGVDISGAFMPASLHFCLVMVMLNPRSMSHSMVSPSITLMLFAVYVNIGFPLF